MFFRKMWLFMNKLIEKFKEGSIYAVTSRVGVGKTRFCLILLSHITENNGEVLFLTDSLDISEIDDYIAKMPITSRNRVYFKQAFHLHKDRLKAYLKEKEYKYLILDSFDNYAYDIDMGDLKEIAIEENIIVVVTKTLSRPPLFSKRKHPVLSDIKFSQKSTQDKFLAYVDVILFAYRKKPTSKILLTTAKNIHGTIGTTIEVGK